VRFIVCGVQTKLESLLLLHLNTLKIIEKRLKMRMLWPPKIKGVKNSKEQTTKHYKY
jgi:hypothetical protein